MMTQLNPARWAASMVALAVLHAHGGHALAQDAEFAENKALVAEADFSPYPYNDSITKGMSFQTMGKSDRNGTVGQAIRFLEEKAAIEMHLELAEPAASGTFILTHRSGYDTKCPNNGRAEIEAKLGDVLVIDGHAPDAGGFISRQWPLPPMKAGKHTLVLKVRKMCSPYLLQKARVEFLALPKQRTVEAYVDFLPYPSGVPNMKNMSLVFSKIKPYQPAAQRIRLVKEGDEISVKFNVQHDFEVSKLELTHFVTEDKNCPANAGGNVLAISLNGKDLAENYSPKKTAPSKRAWRIGKLEKGNYELRIAAKKLCAEYSLTKVLLVLGEDRRTAVFNAYADFSEYPQRTGTVKNLEIKTQGTATSAEYSGALRLPKVNANMQAMFALPRPFVGGKLFLTHLSKEDERCPRNGLSPVFIRIDETILEQGYSPAGHVYEKTSWPLPALDKGSHVIDIRGGDLCSEYWLQRLEIKLINPSEETRRAGPGVQ